MNLGSSETSQQRRPYAILLLLQLVALFLVVVGIRLWMISIYSSSLPIRDQWDYEGAAIFKPWVDGTLHISDFFRPHNEHRLVVARVLGLALLWINGQWDSRLETVVTTLICGLFAVAMVVAFLKIFGAKWRVLIILAVSLWLTLPYGQENALSALGMSYYLLVFFSLIAIWGIGFHQVYSSGWWVGAISLVLACLDMASGVFAAMALLGLLTLRLIKQRVRWQETVFPALLLLAVIGGSIYFRTVVLHHEHLKAASLGIWFHVLARSLAWPFCDAPLVCVLMYLPAGLVAAWYLRARTDGTSANAWRQAETIMVASVWVAMQGAAIAYTRGNSPFLLPVPRYMDMLAFGAIANLLATVFLVAQMQSGSPQRRLGTVLSIIWAAAVGSGAAILSYRELPPITPERILLPYEKSVRGYVATGEHSYLAGEPPPLIPYTNPSRLASLLDDVAIRSILPASVRAPVRIAVGGDNKTAFLLNGYTSAVTNPPYEVTWGSYSDMGERAAGTFQSERITSAFPYLQFEVAGPLLEGMSVFLQDESTSRQSTLKATKNAEKDWRSGYVAMPGKNVRVIARDMNPAGWLAFRQPREAGRLSVYADTLTNLAPFLCLAGGVLGLVSAWPSKPRRSGDSSQSTLSGL